MVLRGSEHASTMLNWAEPKGKAALVLATPSLVKKIITDMHKIRTNLDEKTSKWVTLLDKCM